MSAKPALRFEDLPDFLTIDELRIWLRLGRNAVYELANKPGFPHFKNGNKKIFPKHEVREYIQQEVERERLPRRLRVVGR